MDRHKCFCGCDSIFCQGRAAKQQAPSVRAKQGLRRTCTPDLGIKKIRNTCKRCQLILHKCWSLYDLLQVKLPSVPKPNSHRLSLLFPRKRYDVLLKLKFFTKALRSRCSSNIQELTGRAQSKQPCSASAPGHNKNLEPHQVSLIHLEEACSAPNWLE